MSFTKSEIKKILQSGSARVQFIKQNGDLRDMLCTLDNKKIPKKDHPVSDTYDGNSDTLRVYDLETGAWRSFKIDSVKSVKKT